MEPGDAAERQTDEITVLQAMFEEQLEVTGDAPHAFAVRAADATLEVTLPPRYPYEPPQLVLSCPTAAAGAVTAAVQELTALAGGLGGEECGASVCQRFLEMADDALRAPATPAPAASAGPADPIEEMVLRIDHMNDATGYMRALERWAAEAGLAGVLLFDESGRRVHDVVLVLQGPSKGVATFLQRLRTEMVDVDARGQKCRERQSTVLCRRRAGTFKESYRPAATLQGWRATACASGNARDAALDEIGFLHVGSGAERFGTTASG